MLSKTSRPSMLPKPKPPSLRLLKSLSLHELRMLINMTGPRIGPALGPVVLEMTGSI